MKVKPPDSRSQQGTVNKYEKKKMSGGVVKNRPGSYFVDRALVPRVQRYLKENSHRTYIDVEEMADVLQRQYPDYGRKKKIPFRNSVKQGELVVNLSLQLTF